MRRSGAVAALLGAGLALGALVPTAATAAVPPPVALDLFIHPGHGGGWSSHVLDGVVAGEATPSIAADGPRIVLSDEAIGGDVVVATGTLFGAFTTVDLSATDGVPQAQGAPVVHLGPGAATSIWYVAATGDLEVLTAPTPEGPYSATDVTEATGSPQPVGSPFVQGEGAAAVGYAVVDGGGLREFVPPQGTAGWSAIDPTDGLVYPALAGSVAVFAAPSDPGATVVLAPAATGDVLELTDEAATPEAPVEPWRVIDLSVRGAPDASGPIAAQSGGAPLAAYSSYDGTEAISLSSGLPGGASFDALSSTDDLWPSSPYAPTVVGMPGGTAAVAAPSSTGDLLLVQASSSPELSDVSFEPSTAEYVSSSVNGTYVGGAVALVASDGGPIAPTPLTKRIALLATSFDQEHAGYVTDPSGSDCNRFTFAFGRGSTAGCPAGTAAEAWCSDFADWVWTHAGVDTVGITGWSATFVQWGAAHHRVQWGTHFRAVVGDAIVWGQRSPLYGQHVGIVVAVQGSQLTVVSGNSGGDFPGYDVGVWRYGPFDGPTSTVEGYGVLGVVTP